MWRNSYGNFVLAEQQFSIWKRQWQRQYSGRLYPLSPLDFGRIVDWNKPSFSGPGRAQGAGEDHIHVQPTMPIRLSLQWNWDQDRSWSSHNQSQVGRESNEESLLGRFCCPEFNNKEFTSELNPTPIVSYNRYYTTIFTIEYRAIPSNGIIPTDPPTTTTSAPIVKPNCKNINSEWEWQSIFLSCLSFQRELCCKCARRILHHDAQIFIPVD